MTLALTLGAILALVAVFFVARPFLRDPAPSSDRLDELTSAERARLEALKELEFDHRTGKVTEEDYREQIAPLRRRAAAALKALESGVEPGDERPTRN